MHFGYTFFIRLYAFLIYIASLTGNKKAALWRKGRANLFNDLKNCFDEKRKKGAPLLWFHCASLGEFEQGRPLIEKCRAQYPHAQILLTFFSPSGYEIRKNYSGADFVYYLPLDTPSNAKRFLDIVQPSCVFFIKYEFWFNMLARLKNNGVPVFLVSGIFRKEQYFFSFYGKWALKNLNFFKKLFVQDTQSETLLREHGISSILSGDTRFDRVCDIALHAKKIPEVENFVRNATAIIAGSTWEPDEKMLASFEWKNHSAKLIIAPHEIDQSHIVGIENMFRLLKSVRYTDANKASVDTSQLFLMDTIGMLSSVYRYGKIAYIGGGFGSGIHNILEAAVFGLPVVFGPNYSRFREAVELIQYGGAFAVSNSAELNTIFSKLLSDETFYNSASANAKKYVEANRGAVQIVMKEITMDVKSLSLNS